VQAVPKSPAWTRKEGKSASGGLNAKGRASAKTQGMNLKPPVKSGDNPRRASFLARMGTVRYYLTYLYQVLRYGYWDAPMEVEARAYAVHV
jgi:hypothetical protein